MPNHRHGCIKSDCGEIKKFTKHMCNVSINNTCKYNTKYRSHSPPQFTANAATAKQTTTASLSWTMCLLSFITCNEKQITFFNENFSNHFCEELPLVLPLLILKYHLKLFFIPMATFDLFNLHTLLPQQYHN